MVDRCSVRGEWRGEKKRGEIKERPAAAGQERGRAGSSIDAQTS